MTTAVVPVEFYPVATLQATAERAESYAEASRSPNTRRAYASAWGSFSRWCEGHGLAALPAEPGTVALYLTDLSDSGRKVATVSLHATVIGQAHREAMAPDPTTHPRVKALLGGIRREQGVAPVRKRPILADDLREMLAHVPAGIRGVRDKALLLVAFYSACRRSELSALRVEHVTFDERGATIAIIMD